jgi:hypothetical protein
MEFLFGQSQEPEIPHFWGMFVHKVLLWIMSSFLLRIWWKNSYYKGTIMNYGLFFFWGRGGGRTSWNISYLKLLLLGQNLT